MKTSRILNAVVLAAAAQLTGWFCAQAQYTFETLDHPLADPSFLGTGITGISGTTLVGYYSDGSRLAHGFIYDGVTWRTVDHPSGSNTTLGGISGTNITGSYSDQNTNAQAFIYNGTDFIALKFPGALKTTAAGISGSSIVGEYSTDGTSNHGFLYDGSNYTTLDYPIANLRITEPQGIWGNEVVGYYTDESNVNHGFIYTNNSWTTLDAPAAASLSGAGAFARGVSGSSVVGFFIDTNFYGHGFLFDGSKFTVVDDPLATLHVTHILGISGSSLVGTFRDGVGWHGFLATLPTPPLLSITNAGGVVRIFWPYPSTGWSLQQNADIGTTNWVPSTGVSNDGANNLLTVVLPSGTQFFRLTHP